MDPCNPLPSISEWLSATILEAVLGAIALDAGVDAVKQAMIRLGLIEA